MRALAAILGVVFTLAYPVAVYVGLMTMNTRALALMLLALVSLVALTRLSSAGRAQLVPALKGPALIIPLLGLSYVFDSRQFLFAMPVLISLVLLGSFAGSLRGPMPIVERFARMQVSDLSDEEVRYCRSVTQVWCVFFVCNAALAASLAWFAPVKFWALYTGLIAYVLMGVLGATEYVVRKARFGRFNAGPIDRLLNSALMRFRSGQ